MKPPFDCQTCGACCCNTARNKALGTRDYVEVTKGDMLFRDHKETLKRFAVRNDDGVWHLRLVGDEQRCAALDGDIGEGVGCEIYRVRPRGCRLVEAGDQECLIARKTHGLSVEVV